MDLLHARISNKTMINILAATATMAPKENLFNDLKEISFYILRMCLKLCLKCT